jgi:cytochrome c-type biogenesis protein CcmE
MALGTGTRIALGVALAGAVSYLVLSDTGEGVLEYVFVDKLMASPDEYKGRTIRVHGIVVPGTIKQRVGATGDYQFVIEHGRRRLAVHYTNLVPDTFQEGGEVVLTGKLEDAGDLFVSDEMSAKCPSKYEEQDAVSSDPRES